jgi:MerR family transcriptional regulator, mercuric resistance operon regulatory protein
MAQGLTIGQLALAAGVNVETVRYYQRRKLMPEPPRPLGGTRRYTEADAQRLRFIKRAQAMGFALADIETLLRLGSGRSCRTTRELASAKLEAVDERIRDLRRLRTELAKLVSECDQNRTADCPIIERLMV